uniref:Ephrin RBD domain-containing protein n=1 Tax=Meloidogyne hapla TaxID=6305 RepID=A0A1I8BJ88_MELHA
LIETSKDCSKIMPNIKFYLRECPSINPSIRAENVKKRDEGYLCVSYKLSNIYNPNVRYYVKNIEDEGLTFTVNVKRIK